MLVNKREEETWNKNGCDKDSKAYGEGKTSGRRKMIKN